MNLESTRRTAGHPSYRTAVGTAVAYGIVLLLMFVVLFLLPYVLFVSF